MLGSLKRKPFLPGLKQMFHLPIVLQFNYMLHFQEVKDRAKNITFIF